MWLIAKQSDGGFMETNSELEFVYLKSPVIALRAMPPSFSKRVFLTSFEKGGGAKRRRIFGRQTPIQSLSPKNHPSSHFVRCHPLFQRGLTSFEKGGGAERRRIFERQTPIQSLSPKNHPSSHFVRCHPLFQRGFAKFTEVWKKPQRSRGSWLRSSNHHQFQRRFPSSNPLSQKTWQFCDPLRLKFLLRIFAVLFHLQLQANHRPLWF